MTGQKDFWEQDKVLRRRSPDHPAIEAFVSSKIERVVRSIRRSAGEGAGSGLSLLDVGAGNGYFSYHLNKIYRVTSLDFSATILSVCPIRDRVQASAAALPFPAGTFDVVFCSNMLHHLSNPSEAVDEMVRVSARFIAVVEPNRSNPFMYAISRISKEDRLVGRYSAAYLKGLVGGKARILSLEKDGFILPNITPPFLLPLLRGAERYLYPKMFHVLVAEKRP